MSGTSRETDGREHDRAMRFVVNSLAAKAQSTAEIERKLAARGVSPEVAEAVVAKARALRYLDDAELAGQLARGFRTRGYGRRRADLALRRRGVPPAEAVRALEEVFGTVDAAVLAAKALGSRAIVDADTERRAVAFLMRRGFPPEAAWSAVRARSTRDR